MESLRSTIQIEQMLLFYFGIPDIITIEGEKGEEKERERWKKGGGNESGRPQREGKTEVTEHVPCAFLNGKWGPPDSNPTRAGPIGTTLGLPAPPR